MVKKLQGWAKVCSLGCVNSRPVARGSQEAGFTQPRDVIPKSSHKVCDKILRKKITNEAVAPELVDEQARGLNSVLI